MKVLVLNAGSSSQKCCLFEVEPGGPATQPIPLWEASLEGPRLQVRRDGKVARESTVSSLGLKASVLRVLGTLFQGPEAVLEGPQQLSVVGHRVVHGGLDYRSTTLVTQKMRQTLAQLASLAPAHNPAAVAGMEAVEELNAQVPQVAVFDTAFHATLADSAAFYPGPYAWAEQGKRRFGFHGISHEDSARRAAMALGRSLQELNFVTCHLGNGCSLAAVSAGKSVDTTMGFTPLEGLMMGTRCGSVDPGLLLSLLDQPGATARQLGRVVNDESGLLGISGVSGDLREVLAARLNGHARATLAIDMYVHSIKRNLGAMAASLPRVDAIVFTGGVGEHSAEVRQAVCGGIPWLQAQLDEGLNQACTGDGVISSPAARCAVVVMTAQEDWAIARKCVKFAKATEASLN